MSRFQELKTKLKKHKTHSLRCHRGVKINYAHCERCYLMELLRIERERIKALPRAEQLKHRKRSEKYKYSHEQILILGRAGFPVEHIMRNTKFGNQMASLNYVRNVLKKHNVEIKYERESKNARHQKANTAPGEE